MRRKKLIYNTISSVINQLVTLICGFIIPRMVMLYYGSETNGLLSSITNFLAFFSLMEMGVGAVVRASLYKPLADGDDNEISKVLISSRRFFRRIGTLLCIYSVGLMVMFPVLVDKGNGFVSTAILVGAVAFSSICQYMFGIVYQQLLNADQRVYIQNVITCITLVLNTIFSVVLMSFGASIQSVKIVAALVLLLKPLLLKVYVERRYNLNFKLSLTNEPLKQKWNGFAQHIAVYVLKHSGTIILTFFSTLQNVSIYYVYHLITVGLQQLIEIVTSAFSSLLGDMFVREEKTKLDETFSVFEWVVHTMVIFSFAVAGVLIIPFVKVYTNGITDANYIVPVFATLTVIANGLYCLRLPYTLMVNAAGHFKETQTSAIIEVILNISISLLLVGSFGLIAVALGALIATAYRIAYMVFYLQKNILLRKLKYFIKHIIVDTLTVLLIVVFTHSIPISSESYFLWAVDAVKISLISLVVIVAVNILFFKKLILKTLKLLRTIRK